MRGEAIGPLRISARTATTAGGLALALLLSILIGGAMADSASVRLAVALSVAVPLMALATARPRLALYGFLIWLVALGLVRRLLTSVGPTPPFGDPLLLVAPLVLTILFAIAVERGALRNLTPLSLSVLGLTAVLALSALNPMQGGLSVGLGGALLIVVPMLSFWIGRSLLDDHTATGVVRVLAVTSVLAATYGLTQTLNGLPSWDAAWAENEGYAALQVGDVIRPFGTSSSAAGYATLLAVGILAWRAIASRSSRILLILPLVGLLGAALWLASSRGIVVLTLVALWLTIAAARRFRLRYALLGALALLLVLPTSVAYIAPSSGGTGALSSLNSHQIEGLTEPFGPGSTLPAHLAMVGNGMQEAAMNPLGRGVGSTTVAAIKYRGESQGTEADLGNAPVAAGILGLVLYVLVAWYGLTAAYRLARKQRGPPAIAALGILIVTFLQWLTGGQYAIAVLPWLFLGWIDAASVASSTGVAQPATSAKGDR